MPACDHRHPRRHRRGGCLHLHLQLALVAILIATRYGACFAMTEDTFPNAAVPVPADSAEHDAIVDAAFVPALTELGKPASLAVGRLQAIDDWVFLLAELRAPGGGPFDFSDTRFAEQAAAGSLSPVYVALLRKQADGSWKIVARSLGPGDVIWESWSHEYGAPAALFDLQP